jgi:sortase A
VSEASSHSVSPRVRETARRNLRLLERLCLCSGALLVAAFASSQIAAQAGRAQGLASFARAPTAADRALWSDIRIREYEASVGVEMGEPLAVLRIPSVNIEVPVYVGTSDLNLNRGAGLIEGMATPDAGGNVGIAGHRDGFFRALKDIKPGDRIELQTRTRTHAYRVTEIEIVDASDLSLLTDSLDPVVTLVTCYPFYYVGHAPQRFLVRGIYEWSPSSPGHA